jgi:hypothetical protein
MTACGRGTAGGLGSSLGCVRLRAPACRMTGKTPDTSSNPKALKANNRMRYLVSAMLLIVGLIHLLPLSGALGGERLASLYGLAFTEPNLEILMRHRAVLFGLLGAFLVFSAFKPAYQAVAFVGGFVSVASFLCVAWSVGGYNHQVARVFTADIVALVCLVVGAAAHAYVRRQAS